MSLQEVARRTGCPLRFLVGVREVESGGDPKAVRFEPHLFLRHCPKRVVTIPRGTPPAVAVSVRRTTRADKKVPYTPGKMRDGTPRAASSVATETDRAAFEFAFAIDAVAAVLSSSWGSYQQLGGSFRRALDRELETADDARAVVAAFDTDPHDVSDALLAAWLLDNPKALAAAKKGDVEEFVKRYNGGPNPGYCAKMRAAFAKFDAGKLTA
jgi:hypothetical protein